jgi:TfoX/Sxy family transcriptional regulator of competence genes
MTSAQRNVDFVLEQMAGAGDVSARKMFGEYGIYCSGKLVALFCDDQLFMKPTDAARSLLGKVTEASPYPGAKPYFLVSGDRCEDADWLAELTRVTACALPKPAPKAQRAAAKPAPKAAKLEAKSARGAAPGTAAPSSKPAAKKRAQRS